ncbi:uncharacterized protein isoform X3 [Choristoneura fumiferana]|uniref:uncharacterized protein isoform X3 n=1 Tax=Choristoneura fumiferana TaxID=7141 RepID=UPI003D158139
MAFTKLLIVTVLAVGAHAKFVWQNDNEWPAFQQIRMPKMPEMKPFKFEPITFKPIVFEPIPPIDTEKLKTYQPKEGEQFFGSSVTSFSSSKTVNGKTVSEGGGSVIVNDNGKADEQHVVFHEGDKGFAEE